MDGWDMMALIGLAMVGAGLWMVAPWLALVVEGTLLLIGGVAGAWLRARRGGEDE